MTLLADKICAEIALSFTYHDHHFTFNLGNGLMLVLMKVSIMLVYGLYMCSCDIFYFKITFKHNLNFNLSGMV